MKESRPLVSIVDDDESVRESLPDLLRQLGFDARAFDSARALLVSDALSRTRCLILDIAMPGMTGPELQQELARHGNTTPIIFITGHPDEAVRRHVQAHGAASCLSKPFSEAALLAALNAALELP